MSIDTIQYKTIVLKVNGNAQQVTVPTHMTALQMLKEKLFLTGAKEGCGVGECGSCTIMLNGKAVNGCMVLAVECDGAEIATIEGQSVDGNLNDLQQAFIDHGAIQCGFCTPGMIMSAQDLLKRKPLLSRDEIAKGISGNICRCTGYEPIIDAIETVSKSRVKGGNDV
jgi:carbon-monoxide dehydrogenase small subunit